MKIYSCKCGNRVFFENNRCTSCQRELGFFPDHLCLSSLDSGREGLFLPTSKEIRRDLYRKCLNFEGPRVCNWMVPQANPEPFCLSCRLDEVVPDLQIAGNEALWRVIEQAKRRLIYTLLSLRLPLSDRREDREKGLAFRFLADGPRPEERVLTGHDKGVITLNIAEANDGEREHRRLSMNEPYRTLLGHFRHEIGHYYWDRLISESQWLKPFRQVFGNEQTDYSEALRVYYASGASLNWQENFISAYATAHPWEDWAETWAHYLHIQDTLEVALEFKIIKDPRFDLATQDKSWFGFKGKSFKEKIEAWSDLTVALNCINRSMGLKDVYPFVLSEAVINKLRFVSQVISSARK